jgi:FkbM family methyltransferase
MATALSEIVREGKRAIKSILPRPVLNWREAHYYEKHGEVELHLLEFLCDPARDSIDVGAHDGCYIHFLKRLSRRVYAFEPLPALAANLKRKFPSGVVVKEMALSSTPGTLELRVPVVEGVMVIGCSTLSREAAAAYPGHRAITVAVDTLDNVYSGDAGFLKIDVEGHEAALLEGARNTLARSRPAVLIEVVERLARGGVARTNGFFRELGYRGHFVYRRELLPVEAFDAETMQREDNIPDLTANLDTRERFPDYAYNFLFLPPGEPPATVDRIRAKLAQL